MPPISPSPQDHAQDHAPLTSPFPSKTMNKVVFIKEPVTEDSANSLMALTLYLDSLDQKVRVALGAAELCCLAGWTSFGCCAQWRARCSSSRWS